jgi:hypothetical protein
VKTFIWASPHKPTAEQKVELEKDGVIVYLEEIAPFTFKNLTNMKIDTDLDKLAERLIYIVQQYDYVNLVQPAGSPAFQCVLGTHLKEKPICILYAFSERKSVDLPQEDGTIRKLSVFQHMGWIRI